MFRRIAKAFPFFFLAVATVVTFFTWVWVEGYRPGQVMYDEITHTIWVSSSTPYLIALCAFGIFIGGAIALAATGKVYELLGGELVDDDSLGIEYSSVLLIFTAIPMPFLGHPSAPESIMILPAVWWSAAFYGLLLFTIFAMGRSQGEVMKLGPIQQRAVYIWAGFSMGGSAGLLLQMYVVLVLGWSPWLSLLGLAAYAFLLRAAALYCWRRFNSWRFASFT